MGLFRDTYQRARGYLARDNEGLGEDGPMVAAVAWACGLCGGQGSWVKDRNETSPFDLHWVAMGRCAAPKHAVAQILWGVDCVGQTSAVINIWAGGELRGQIRLKGVGVDGLAETRHVLGAVAQAAQAIDGLLLQLVPPGDAQGDGGH